MLTPPTGSAVGIFGPGQQSTSGDFARVMEQPQGMSLACKRPLAAELTSNQTSLDAVTDVHSVVFVEAAQVCDWLNYSYVSCA